MKCKKCKRIIEDNSIYCNWCGHQQLTASNEVRVPKPTHKGNKWFARVTVAGERVYVDGNSEDEYYAKAQAIRRRGVPTWGVFMNEYEQGGGPLIDIGTHALDRKDPPNRD